MPDRSRAHRLSGCLSALPSSVNRCGAVGLPTPRWPPAHRTSRAYAQHEWPLVVCGGAWRGSGLGLSCPQRLMRASAVTDVLRLEVRLPRAASFCPTVKCEMQALLWGLGQFFSGERSPEGLRGLDAAERLPEPSGLVTGVGAGGSHLGRDAWNVRKVLGAYFCSCQTNLTPYIATTPLARITTLAATVGKSNVRICRRVNAF